MEIRSIRDISYEFRPNTSFHPLLLDSAKLRIRKEFQQTLPLISEHLKHELDTILNSVLESPKLRQVWAAVLQYCGMPLMTIRNLAHTNTTLPYRRVLVVNLDVYLFPAAYALAA